MQQHGSRYCRPNPKPQSKGRNSTLPNHGHVAYQIKCNHERSNMLEIICPTFSEHGLVAYQIKGNDGYSNMVRRPGGRGGGAEAKFNFFLSQYGHVAYQIKGNDACSNMVANICPCPTKRPPANMS